MLFKKHLNLIGSHALLSASKSAWLNHEDEAFDRWFHQNQAAARGTALHELACRLITLGVRLPDTEETINRYVNDAIDYKMTPEQILFYSLDCYGTADAIAFRRKKLRIHDLKSGIIKTGERQLYVYAALFFLEYPEAGLPFEIETELRIYQNNDVRIHIADPAEIAHIMGRIKERVARLEQLRLEL